MLKMNINEVSSLRDKYMYTDAVSSIDDRNQKLFKFKEMMASYGSMIYIYALISVIIGFAIIYSSSVITLSERSRELASMMVLGMTHKEVLSVVTFEQWCIAVPAMLAGMPLSKSMMAGISSAMSTDIYTGTDYFFSITNGFVVTGASIWVAKGSGKENQKLESCGSSEGRSKGVRGRP